MYSGLESVLIVAVVIMGYVIIRIKGKEEGAKEKYQRIAGKPIVIGKDPVPKRLKAISFQIRGVGARNWSNNERRFIVDCETVIPGMPPETIVFDKWINISQIMYLQVDKIFQLSETGELEFNRQPDL